MSVPELDRTKTEHAYQGGQWGQAVRLESCKEDGYMITYNDHRGGII